MLNRLAPNSHKPKGANENNDSNSRMKDKMNSFCTNLLNLIQATKQWMPSNKQLNSHQLINRLFKVKILKPFRVR